MSLLRSSLARAASVALLACPALAGTWIVDAFGNPGADFTDLQTAIDQSAPGDLLLLRSGLYPGFDLASGRTLLGVEGEVIVLGGTRIHDLPADDIVVLSRLRMSDLGLNRDEGLVLLDELTIDGWGTPALEGQSLLWIADCHDVRVQRCAIDGSFTESVGAVFARASRVELVQSELIGADGFAADCGVAGRGGDALELAAEAFLHSARSDFVGGAGGPNTADCMTLCGFAAGDGGYGIELGFLNGLPSPRALVLGIGSDTLRGGAAGQGSACPCDGFSGYGLRLLGGQMLLSQQVPAAGPATCPGHEVEAVAVGGLAELFPTGQPWPTLALLSTPHPGEDLVLELRGTPGDSVHLAVGLRPSAPTEVGMDVCALVRPRRGFELGSIEADGRKLVVLQMPTGYPKGSLVLAQAEVGSAQGLRRTNSIALALR